MVELPTSLAKPRPGAITTGTQTHTSISVSTVNATGPSGRPLVALRANDQTVLCFLDTGSEATLIRPSILRRLDPQNNLRRIRSSKLLRGVTGQPLATTSEVTLHFQLDDDLFIPHQVTLVDVTYPGDILLGMDFLRRLDFSLTHDPNTTSSCLSLEGRPFSVVYTDVESLHVRVISTTASNPETPAEFSTEMLPTQDHKHSPGIAVHLTARTDVPPHTGCFLDSRIARAGPRDGDVIVTPTTTGNLILPHSVTTVKDRCCFVWAVNPTPKTLILHGGTRLGTVASVEALFTAKSKPPLTEQSKTVLARSDVCPVKTDSPAIEVPEDKASSLRAQARPSSDDFSEEVEDSSRILSSNNLANTDSQGEDKDTEFEWEEEDFIWEDFADTLLYEDFDDSDAEVEQAELPPSLAIAACEAAEQLLSSPLPDESSLVPDLSHLDTKSQHQLTELLNQHKELFEGGEETVGLVPGISHKIDTGDAKPVSIRQWRLPQSTRQAIRDQCDSMLDAGVIEPSTSPWLSPVVLVKKKGGGLRFCVDYRGLNAVTKKDAYPLPRINELIDELGPMDTFTTLDARAAYWSVELETTDRPKTAFSDGYRLFQFCRLPFGLSTAPTTFQRTMNIVLAPVLGRHTLAYLDDVIIYSRGFTQHLQHLSETLQLLSSAGLKLNPQKCQFAASTIDFLGFTISPGGVSPNQEKVTAISKTPAPRTVREVRRFLGATGFYRKHIPDYATVASPLHLLLKKGQKWIWGAEQQSAFEELKLRLTTAPVLRQPDFSRDFELHTDASSVALGACLMQRDVHNTPYAIAYYSRKLRDAETRYPAIDLEALAVVEGVRVFDSYLYGRHFTVYTDHRPLVYIFSRKTKSPRMTRFAHDLSFYDFNIRYKEGPTNHVPDLLSRQVAKLTITDLSPERLAAEQEADPLLSDVRKYLVEGTLPKKKLPLPLCEFELKDNVVYRLKHFPDRICYQLFVPQKLRNSALKASHLPPLASHPGIHRTFQNARAMFYWPNMLRDVRQYVDSCLICQQSRGSMQKVPMADTPLAEFPLERVSMDLMDFGPSIPVRWALSILDQHSRFLQIVPLRKATAAAVHSAFMDHWVTLFGPPRVIQTDNGIQFTSNIFRELTKMMHATNHYTIRYHPQANGMVERTNRVVKAALTTLVGNRPRVWHQFVPELRLQINSAIHRTTGEQPIYLLTGRHANFPVGLTNEAIFAENLNLQGRLQEARQAAVEASRQARQIYGRYYDRGKKIVFQPTEGSLVWYYEHKSRMGGLPPLSGKWRGPARVIRRLGPVSFEVLNLDTGVQLKAHLNHLKPYRPSEELSYAVDDDDEEGRADDEEGRPGDEEGPANDEEGPGDDEEGGEDGTNQPGAAVQDADLPEDPWVSVLTSFAREPEERRELNVAAETLNGNNV